MEAWVDFLPEMRRKLMKRSRLIAARGRKNWTLEVAAEQLGVAVGTLCRWEHGITIPYAFNIEKLCTVYGMSAADLGLEHYAREQEADLSFPVPVETPLPALQEDLTLRLFALLMRSRRATSRELQGLQAKVVLTAGEYATMNTNNQNYQITRRKALQRLALLPLMTPDFSPLSAIMHHPFEDFLIQCAAGITACGLLCKGKYEDLALAWSTLSAYLPSLKTIVKDSAQHRKAAAHLATQCLQTKATLALHFESSREGLAYAKEAVIYGEESGNTLLQVTSLRRLAWTYFYARQYKQALTAAEKGAYLAEHSHEVFSPQVASGIMSALALMQAKNGLPAIATLSKAHRLFDSPDRSEQENDLLYLDFGRPHLLLDDGKVHASLGLHAQALASFTQLIDVESLSPKRSFEERLRVDTLIGLVLTSLKLPQKDRELSIRLWRASIQEARALQSELRFNEACMAHDMMEGIWPDEACIQELRELTVHW
jgi:transcriptional regulator with XRE-family HTH domain